MNWSRKRLHLPEGEAPQAAAALVRPLLLVPVELQRYARRFKACWYAPTGWVAWRRGLLADWPPRCVVLSGVGASDSGRGGDRSTIQT